MTRVPGGASAANNPRMSARGLWPMVAIPSVVLAMSRLQHHRILRTPPNADPLADGARRIGFATSFFHEYRRTIFRYNAVERLPAEKVCRHDPTGQQARLWRSHNGAFRTDRDRPRSGATRSRWRRHRLPVSRQQQPCAPGPIDDVDLPDEIGNKARPRSLIDLMR